LEINVPMIAYKFYVREFQMKRSTYFLAFLTVVLLLLSAGSAVKADVIDPKIGLGGGGSCGETRTQESLNQDFTLGSDQLGCIVDFNNATGSTLFSLTITINTAFSGDLSCIIDLSQPGNGGTSPFSFAQKTAPNACTFSGGPITPDDAVEAGSLYGVQFGYPDELFQTCDSNGVCTPLESLSLTLAGATPEPGSMVLIGTGLAALVARKKKLWANRTPS
jgi:hypothetical protein